MRREEAAPVDVTRVCRNCGARHSPKNCCPPHREARAIGRADGLTGEPAGAERWPSGTYGHADYWVGFYAAKATE